MQGVAETTAVLADDIAVGESVQHLLHTAERWHVHVEGKVCLLPQPSPTVDVG